MQYNERLKEARIDADITQQEAAEILETTQQQIYKYEKGIQEMTIIKLKKLCEAYRVSADYILGLPKGLKWPRG